MRVLLSLVLGLTATSMVGCLGAHEATDDTEPSVVVDYSSLRENHYCSFYIQTLTVWVDGTPQENALVSPCNLGHAVIENVSPGNHWVFMAAHGLKNNSLLMSQAALVTVPESGPTRISFNLR